ncbi:MAG: glycoside hydrolase family 20 protein [Parabacteroides sp.]|nr:glycoside hydrolase family 20 protein [Parabacteroides sp.]
MTKNKLTLLFCLICLITGCTSSGHAQADIIPLPKQQTVGKGHFTFNKGTIIRVENPEQEPVAKLLANLFSIPAGFSPKVQTRTSDTSATIVFTTDTTFAKENYKLEISPSHISIKAADISGFFYAVQSIRQLLPPAIESNTPVNDTLWSIPALTIQDGPRFPYRGLLLDVSRCFIPKENVVKIIDYMSMLKLNKLHLHLVDDNGWRLEIKKYPRLTKVGAWRVERENDFSQRKNAKAGEPTPVGGFYTQEDMKEIIAYAAERQVEIIPEIEMPAHTNSSLAAFPELACPVVKDPIHVIPGMGGDASKIVYCAGNDKVFSFLQDVLDEVIDLFPSQYINLGGDEASKKYWGICPLCQARMKAEGFTDIEDLQGYFMNRMADYVKSKGRQVIGWDELTNSKIPDDAIILGWQGLGTAGYKAGQRGHRFIMTPARVLYLIRYQGPQWFEPRTYFGNNTLEDVYNYEPIQPEWDPEVAKKLMGVQGSLWTEFCASPDDVEYLLFPRLAAVGEIAWSGKDRKDWPGFLKRLDVLTQHYDYLGVNYARSMFNLDHLVKGDNDTLKVALTCIRPDMEVRYTTDGSEPQATSALYSDSLTVTGDLTIKAATFADGKRKGKILTLPLHWNKATARPLTNGNEQTYRLTNGLRGSNKQSDFEWCGWYGKDASFTVDLGKTQSFDRVTLGCITNYGMGAHLPKEIVLSVSDDNRVFTQIAERNFTAGQIFHEGIRIEDQAFETTGAAARYLKVDLKNPGKCPKDHTRPGQDTWIYIDEIIIQ